MHEINLQNNEQKELVAAFFGIAFGLIFLLVNFSFGFILPLYLFVAGLLFFISVIHPRSGLYILAFLTIIFEHFFTLFSPVIDRIEYKIYFPDFIILGMLLGGSLMLWKNKNIFKFKLQKESLVLWGFILLNIVYYFVSVMAFDSSAYLSFSSLKNYTFYSLLYFLVFWNIKTERQMQRLLKFYFSAAICLLGFIAYGIINGQGLWTEFTPLSTEGVRILAFAHGLYLALALLPILLFVIFNCGNKLKLKKSLLFLLLAFSVGVLGTMMRHIWVAVGSALLMIYILLRKKEKKDFWVVVGKIIWPVILGIALTFYFSLMLPQSQLGKNMQEISGAVWQRSISIMHASADESFAWRQVVWESAWKKYRNNIIFGIGTGQTVTIEIGDYHDVVEVRNMHNSYLTILMQLGFLGIGFFLSFIFLHLKKLWKNEIRNNFYGLAYLAVLIIFLVAFAFQPYLETNSLSMFFWINLGLIRIINIKQDENSGNK
ncbi:MAG: O-antigen ligase family protein [Candidatus Moraniibacteriota bacterium]